jgi:hypothetical protein
MTEMGAPSMLAHGCHVVAVAAPLVARFLFVRFVRIEVSNFLLRPSLIKNEVAMYKTDRFFCQALFLISFSSSVLPDKKLFLERRSASRKDAKARRRHSISSSRLGVLA